NKISRRRSPSKRWIYKFDKINTDRWQEFSKEVDKKFNYDMQKSQNIQELNKLWHKFNDTIIQAAQKHIPRTRTAHKNFSSDTSKMIDSILNRHSEVVDLSRIISIDSVITDKNNIKLKVKNHFKNWTKLNSASSPLWQQWKTEYEPKENINSSWYKDV